MSELGKLLLDKNIVLDNHWRVKMFHGECGSGNDLFRCCVDVKVFDFNSGLEQLVITGSIKFSGCSDWQTDDLHFCGNKDATIFYEIYELAKTLMPELDEDLKDPKSTRLLEL